MAGVLKMILYFPQRPLNMEKEVWESPGIIALKNEKREEDKKGAVG